MKITYSDHLQFRMNVRKIRKELPESIYRNSSQRYYDHYTLRHIAVMEVYREGRRTLMMVAYDQHQDNAELVTIHSITKQQIRERLRSGRWTYAKTDDAL